MVVMVMVILGLYRSPPRYLNSSPGPVRRSRRRASSVGVEEPSLARPAPFRRRAGVRAITAIIITDRVWLVMVMVSWLHGLGHTRSLVPYLATFRIVPALSYDRASNTDREEPSLVRHPLRRPSLQRCPLHRCMPGEHSGSNQFH